MIIIWGQRLAGKVDRVPGLFYVTTQFFHLYYVPLIPLKTYVVIEGTEEGDGFKGVGVPMSGKSVLIGWLRSALVLGIIASVIFAAIAAFEFADKQNHGAMETLLISLAQLAACVLLYWIAWNFSRASYQRAMDLGEKLGIP